MKKYIGLVVLALFAGCQTAGSSHHAGTTTADEAYATEAYENQPEATSRPVIYKPQPSTQRPFGCPPSG
jgi:curli biogenesis system outer membrane secretion channel CsgG